MPQTDAHIFFNRVRPYMNGWEKSEDLPNGVLYQGVQRLKSSNIPNGEKTPNGTYGKYAGGSAGQSSLIHVLDVAFGVVHTPVGANGVNFIHEMRSYMPGPHRKFVEDLAASYSMKGS